MVAVLVVGCLVVGIGMLVALVRSIRSTNRTPAARPPVPAPRPAGGAVVRPVVPADDDATARFDLPPVEVPRQPLEFAEPGRTGRLFGYGGDVAGHVLPGPYVIVDVETTGFSPAGGDRVVEVAIARVDASGRIEDEYATLVHPGRDVGPVFVHGISNTDIRDAPRFEEIAGELLARMEGAVVVAHNAAFEDRFLAAEFARAGVLPPVSPALCTLWLARRTLRAPNHKLTTLARYAGIPTVDAHAALGDVRTVAALLPHMLRAVGRPLQYPVGFRRMPQLPREARPLTRAVELRRGSEGWMASLMARLPLSAADPSDGDAQRYLESLAIALEDGRIVGTEARELARLAGSAGLGAAQVAELHRQFLESLRELALEDDILTAAEIRKLRTAAQAVGLPDHFADLKPTSPQDLLAAGRIPGARPAICEHCFQTGHFRATCPELTTV